MRQRFEIRRMNEKSFNEFRRRYKLYGESCDSVGYASGHLYSLLETIDTKDEKLFTIVVETTDMIHFSRLFLMNHLDYPCYMEFAQIVFLND